MVGVGRLPASSPIVLPLGSFRCWQVSSPTVTSWSPLFSMVALKVHPPPRAALYLLSSAGQDGADMSWLSPGLWCFIAAFSGHSIFGKCLDLVPFMTNG